VRGWHDIKWVGEVRKGVGRSTTEAGAWRGSDSQERGLFVREGEESSLESIENKVGVGRWKVVGEIGAGGRWVAREWCLVGCRG